MITPLTSRALNRRMAGAGLMRRPARGGGGRLSALSEPDSVANLFAWWRADVSDVTIATGVSVWTDKVAGYQLTQGTPANQPAFTTASELGGRNVLRFDGVNDSLVSADPPALWKFIHTGAGCTVFYKIVSRNAAFTREAVISTGDAGAGVDVGFSAFVFSTNAICLAVDNGAAAAILSQTTTGNVKDVKAIADFSYKEGSSPEFVVRLAGANIATGNSALAPSAADPAYTLTVGMDGAGVNHGQVDIAEIVIYNAELSVGDKTTVYNYLNAA